jgi:hypothetical protein
VPTSPSNYELSINSRVDSVVSDVAVPNTDLMGEFGNSKVETAGDYYGEDPFTKPTPTPLQVKSEIKEEASVGQSPSLMKRSQGEVLI